MQHPPSDLHPDQPSTHNKTPSDDTLAPAYHGFSIDKNEARVQSKQPHQPLSDSDEEEHDDDLLSKTIVLPPPQSPLDPFSGTSEAMTTYTPLSHGPSQRPSAKTRHTISRRSASSTSSSSDQDEVATTQSFIALLPPETLTRILALLDPNHLVKASLVCRKWATIARDDATWRLAFCKAFGLGGGGGVMRRTDLSSWKAEYRTRIDLLR